MAVSLTAAFGGCASEAANGRDWVHKVHFHGNQHLGKGDILDRIQLEETSWIPLTAKKYLDTLTLVVDKKRIEALYRAHGFFNAEVKDVRVKKRGDGSADVDITVDEGPQTKISSVDFHGLDELPPRTRDKVEKKLPLNAGRPFDHDRYLAAKNLVEARWREEGYAWVVVNGEALVNRDDQTADIEFHVQTGPVAHFGKVTVKGTEWGEEVVERTSVHEGARFTPEVIETTRGRLQTVGRFGLVQVKAVPREGHPEIADVEIEVKDGPRNEAKIGIGLGLDQDRQSIHLPMRYTRYGFFGGLRTMQIKVKPAWVALPSLYSPQQQGPALESDITFTQPDFIVRDLQLKLQAGYDLGIDYAFKFHGPRGLAGVEYPFLHDHLVISTSDNFQYLFFYGLVGDIFINAAQAKRFLGYVNPYRLAYILEQLTVDYRDRPLDPHKGVYFRLSAEEGGTYLGGGFNYQKFTPDLRGYYPLHHRLVISARVVYGKLFTQGDSASPITRRFYAGGAESQRGFGYNRLAPQLPGPTGANFAIPVGGDEMFLTQFEMRGDVYKFKGNWLGLAAFVDAADVPERGRTIDFSQLHIAAGPGLRYTTVVGVIRADVGMRLNRLAPFQADGRQNPDPGSRFAFHISIGEAF